MLYQQEVGKNSKKEYKLFHNKPNTWYYELQKLKFLIKLSFNRYEKIAAEAEERGVEVPFVSKKSR